jgi:hypothetical protein
MISLSPNDNPVNNNKSSTIDGDYGGNREFTTGEQRKGQDYKKPTQASVDVEGNPIDKTTKDIDDMADPKARKREFTRRAETMDHSDHNKDRFPESDTANRPLEDTDVTIVPDNKHRRSKLKNQFGSGQYDNNPNRGEGEGEIS